LRYQEMHMARAFRKSSKKIVSEPLENQPVQIELWSTDLWSTELSATQVTGAPAAWPLPLGPHSTSHVSMPLGEYAVHPLPLPGGNGNGAGECDGDNTTISPEHIVCKQPMQSNQVARVD
jgi:hypothetical protein